MKRHLPIFILAVFAVFIFYMNACYHFSSDDCCYALQWLYHGVGVAPVHDSLLTVWRENIADGYRPIPHFFVRLFCGYLPKTYFNIANTAMLIALVVLVIRYATGSWRLITSKVVLAIAVVYGFLCKGESYLWCSGSLNYLWVAVPTLGFLVLRNHIEEGNMSPLRTFIASLFAFFCGWLQEACVMPVCFAICVYSVATIKSLTWRKTFFYGAYGVGAILLLSSTIGRAMAEGGVKFSIIDIGVNAVKIFCGVKALWLLVAMVAIKPNSFGWVKGNIFDFLVILGSLLMMAIVGFTGERSLYAANLLGVVLVVRLVELPRWGTRLLCLGLAILMISLIPLAYRIHENFESFLNMYQNSKDGVAVHEYVDCGMLGRFFHQTIYNWQQEGHMLFFAAFYGKGKPVYGLSRYMYDNLYLEDRFCIDENKLPIDGDFYAREDQNAIVMPVLAEQNISAENYRLRLEYVNSKRLIDRLRYEIEARRYPIVAYLEMFTVLCTAHGDYILLAKRPFCKETIKRIEFLPKD